MAANAVVFPDCCAFIVLNGFGGGHPGAPADNCISESAFERYLSAREKEHFNQRTGLLIALSHPQNERLEKVLRARKWEALLHDIPNPRTGQRIYLWFRNLNHTEARKKRIFG